MGTQEKLNRLLSGGDHLFKQMISHDFFYESLEKKIVVNNPQVACKITKKWFWGSDNEIMECSSVMLPQKLRKTCGSIPVCWILGSAVLIYNGKAKVLIDGKSDLEDQTLQAERILPWLFLPDMDDSENIFKCTP